MTAVNEIPGFWTYRVVGTVAPEEAPVANCWARGGCGGPRPRQHAAEALGHRVRLCGANPAPAVRGLGEDDLEAGSSVGTRVWRGHRAAEASRLTVWEASPS